jgi:hypothetical protein
MTYNIQVQYQLEFKSKSKGLTPSSSLMTRTSPSVTTNYLLEHRESRKKREKSIGPFILNLEPGKNNLGIPKFLHHPQLRATKK